MKLWALDLAVVDFFLKPQHEALTVARLHSSSKALAVQSSSAAAPLLYRGSPPAELKPRRVAAADAMAHIYPAPYRIAPTLMAISMKALLMRFASYFVCQLLCALLTKAAPAFVVPGFSLNVTGHTFCNSNVLELDR